MLLATILLLCPFPQIEGATKTVTNDSAAVASDSTNSTAILLSPVAIGTRAQK